MNTKGLSNLVNIYGELDNEHQELLMQHALALSYKQVLKERLHIREAFPNMSQEDKRTFTKAYHSDMQELSELFNIAKDFSDTQKAAAALFFHKKMNVELYDEELVIEVRKKPLSWNEYVQKHYPEADINKALELYNQFSSN